eukprot:3661406-Amphidinium_carterae.1
MEGTELLLPPQALMDSLNCAPLPPSIPLSVLEMWHQEEQFDCWRSAAMGYTSYIVSIVASAKCTTSGREDA